MFHKTQLLSKPGATACKLNWQVANGRNSCAMNKCFLVFLVLAYPIFASETVLILFWHGDVKIKTANSWKKPEKDQEIPLSAQFKIGNAGRLDFEWNEKIFKISKNQSNTFQKIVSHANNASDRVGAPTTVGGVRGLKDEKSD